MQQAFESRFRANVQEVVGTKIFSGSKDIDEEIFTSDSLLTVKQSLIVHIPSYIYKWQVFFCL